MNTMNTRALFSPKRKERNSASTENRLLAGNASLRNKGSIEINQPNNRPRNDLLGPNITRRTQGPPGPNRTRNKGLSALNSPRYQKPPGNRTRKNALSNSNNEGSYNSNIARMIANASSREKSRSESQHRENENNQESLLARVELAEELTRKVLLELTRSEELTRLALSRLHPDNRSEILSKGTSVKPVKLSAFVGSTRMPIGRLTNPILSPLNVLTLELDGNFLGKLESKVTLPQLCIAMANFITDKGKPLKPIEIGIGAIIKALGDTKQLYFGGMSILHGPYHRPWRYDGRTYQESDQDPPKLILGIRQKDNKDRETVLTTPSIFSIQIYHANEAYGRLSFIFPLFTLLIKGILLNGESTQSPGVDLYEIINAIVKDISFYKNNGILRRIQGVITGILKISFVEESYELVICGIPIPLIKLIDLNSMVKYINDILKRLFGVKANQLNRAYKSDYLMVKMSEFNATFLLFYLADSEREILKLSNTLYVLNMLGIVEKGHDFSDKERTAGLDCIPAREALTAQLSTSINIAKQVHLIKKKVTHGEGDDKTTFYAYLISGPINRNDDFTFTCSSKQELGTSRSIGFDIQIGYKGFTFETCDFPDHDCIATIEPVRKLDKPCELFPPSDDIDAMRTYQSLDGVITYSHGPSVVIPSLDATLNLKDESVYKISLKCMSGSQQVTHQLPIIIHQNEAQIYHIRGFCIETNEIIEIGCGTNDFESFKGCMLNGVLIVEDRPSDVDRRPLSNRSPIQQKNLTIRFPKVVNILRDDLRDILSRSTNVTDFKDILKALPENKLISGERLDQYIYKWLQKIIISRFGNNPTPYSDQIDELRQLSYNSKIGEIDRGGVFTECELSDPAQLKLLRNDFLSGLTQDVGNAGPANYTNIFNSDNIGTEGANSAAFASGVAGPRIPSPVNYNNF